MNDLHHHILIVLVFLTGITGFVAGEFIVSSALLATSAVASNIKLNNKRMNTRS